MATKKRPLQPAEAARVLGVSAKTLRIYEEWSLISPPRTESGWRIYRPEDIETAEKVVSLRNLGLSLKQVRQVMQGDTSCLETALAHHADDLSSRILELQATVRQVRQLRAVAASRGDVALSKLPEIIGTKPAIAATLELPWPWGGEPFELRSPSALNFIVGPLASGKTRLAKGIAEALPGGAFLDLDRRLQFGSETLDADPTHQARVETALQWLEEEGADVTEDLTALISGMERRGPGVLVVDLIEQELSAATQEALASYLRTFAQNSRPLFAMTRSSSILDLEHVGPDTGIIYCPPNHAPPSYVEPYPGAQGYEAVAMCLASPQVRKRTAGVVARWQPKSPPDTQTTKA